MAEFLPKEKYTFGHLPDLDVSKLDLYSGLRAYWEDTRIRDQKELRKIDKSFEHYLDMEDNNPEATTPALKYWLARRHMAYRFDWIKSEAIYHLVEERPHLADTREVRFRSPPWKMPFLESANVQIPTPLEMLGEPHGIFDFLRRTTFSPATQMRLCLPKPSADLQAEISIGESVTPSEMSSDFSTLKDFFHRREHFNFQMAVEKAAAAQHGEEANLKRADSETSRGRALGVRHDDEAQMTSSKDAMKEKFERTLTNFHKFTMAVGMARKRKFSEMQEGGGINLDIPELKQIVAISELLVSGPEQGTLSDRLQARDEKRQRIVAIQHISSWLDKVKIISQPTSPNSLSPERKQQSGPATRKSPEKMLVDEEATSKDRSDQSDDETTEDEQQDAITSSRTSLDSNDNLSKGKPPDRSF